MAKKRLLTWHKPSKRWKKQIDGVVHYFGYGRSEDDSKLRQQAEQKYLEFMDRRLRHEPVAVPLGQASLADVFEKYMQQLEQRHQGGDISASYLDRSRRMLGHFLNFIGSRVPFATVGELCLEDYRTRVLSKLCSAEDRDAITPWTAKDRLSHVKTFVTWAYEMHLLEQMPRNLSKFARVEMPEPKPKIFTVEELDTLWDAACPRLRCFIALALNCGYGAKDIADLRVNEIDFVKGCIDRRRSKTKIRARHKLWSLTLQLVTAEMEPDAKGDDLAFRTKLRNGNALVQSRWVDGKYKRSDSISCMLWRVQRNTAINEGRSFYSLRRTGATMIERINPTVTEMYFGSC